MGPSVRISQTHFLRPSGLNQMFWQLYTIQLLFEGLPEIPFVPQQHVLSFSIPSILSFIPWGYLREALFVYLCGSYCLFSIEELPPPFLLHHVVWLTCQEIMKLAPFPGLPREQPLKASAALLWHRHTFSEGAWIVSWVSFTLSLGCSGRLGSSAGLCRPVSAKATWDQPCRRWGEWDGNLTHGHLENHILTTAICETLFLGNFIILSWLPNTCQSLES